jgi:hypothetical protein
VNTALPDIWTLISCPVLGELGPDTSVVLIDPCEVCGQKYRPLISFLDYQFDGWDGEELVTVSDVYASTRRLFDACQRTGLKGFSARPMKISRGPVMEHLDPDKEIAIPDFVQLWIDGEADGPSGWWKRGPVCSACKRIIWKYTDRVLKAMFAANSGKPGPPRLVWPKSWEGDDIFTAGDPGPPVVTARFKEFMERQKVQGLVFAPAQWTQRSDQAA